MENGKKIEAGSAREQILAGEGSGEELNPEEVLAQANDAKKERWIAILIQLTNFRRFNDLVDANWVIQDIVDEEKKTIETRVIEKPIAVGPRLSMKQIYKMKKALELNGCTNVEGAFVSILSALGQENAETQLVTSATDSDISTAKAQADLKNKLDA